MSVRLGSLLAQRHVVVAAAAIASAFAGRSARAEDDRLACLAESEDAQRAYQAGALRDAHERFLRCARADCPKIVRDDCEASLAQVEAALPTIIVVPHDANGRDVQGVRLLVDGAVVAERLEGRALPVEPGAHTIRIERAGMGAAEQSVVVREGEKRRVVDVAFTGPVEPPAPATPRYTAYAFAGLGVVALGVGTYFGIRALDGNGSLRDGCGAAHACTADEASHVRTEATIADVSFAVALVAGGVATWLFLRAPAVNVGVAPTRGGAALRMERAF